MKKLFSTDTNKLVGTVTKQLYNTEKLRMALDEFHNGNFEKSRDLINQAIKPIFKFNKLGKFVFIRFGYDLKVPFLFGKWTKSAISENLVVTKGKEVVARLINGVSTTPATYMGIGTGTTAAAAGDTTLQTEITTGGGARGSATCTNVTTTTTNDTAQFVRAYNFTGTFAVTEEGLFDAVSAGNLLARHVFSAINVSNGDTLQITHKIQLA